MAERKRRQAERELNQAIDDFCGVDREATTYIGVVVTNILFLIVGLICYVVLR